jgi:allophanate hydrolase subunit 1
MKYLWEHFHLSVQKFIQRLSERLYVPSQTGSHDMGNQYLGDLASSYIEHPKFQLPNRPVFRGVKLSKH